MVLASDSRGTIGDPRMITAQNDTQKKVSQRALEKEIRRILSGEPIKELPDKAKIKWSKLNFGS
jgi:hypothetical protein